MCIRDTRCAARLSLKHDNTQHHLRIRRCPSSRAGRRLSATNASRRQWKRVIFAILLAIVAAPASLFFWGLAAGSGENHQTVDIETTGMK